MKDLTEATLEIEPDRQEADRPQDERTSRRRFFTLGATLAAASLGGSSNLQAQQPPTGKSSAARGMVRRLLNQAPDPSFDPFKKVTITTKGWDAALTRLVRRVTNGVTEEEMKLARKLGFYGYLNYHLAPSKIEDGVTQAWVGENAPLLQGTPDSLYQVDARMVQDQLFESTVFRAAFSKRQLQERLVELWSDHFNISFNDVRYLKIIDDREVIRKYALGKFPAMLTASAHSAAMLEYLDNTRNRRTTLNENYAREIMELHSVGVNGGYSQTDVRELARCLTGWTIARRGDFAFDPNGHDFAEKNVLGQRIAAIPSSAGAQGKTDGDTMVAFLAKHPKTAEYIAWKMLRYFLQYDPSAAQIAAVASVYTKTSGDIPSMVRAVLTPSNLLAATPKYKRPYTYLLSTMRATVDPTKVSPRISQLTFRYLPLLGQGLFAWEPPDGYPDRADYWAGGVLQRWNFANYITTTTSTEASMDFGRFWNAANATANTPDTVLDAISRHLFGGEMPDRLKAQVRTYLAGGTLNTARAREGIALAISSSTFSWL
ncbi:MAG: DUF1800 domain-containing protein [Gemmatimonadetes bacterium]|nr:DUF1800 domain-containing protein [Gemmatimonadota bacterium]